MHGNTDVKFLELIRSTKQRVYDFITLMTQSKEEADEIIVDVFRSFGSVKLESKSEIDLFTLAWRKLQIILRKEVSQMSYGRDTRVLSTFDENLINQQELNPEKQILLFTRFNTIDADYRVPVVLKDVLKFEDEEVLKILGLRWGVYRHRLHRGRLETKEALKGRVSN